MNENGVKARCVAIDPAAELLDHWPLTGGLSSEMTAVRVRLGDGSLAEWVIRSPKASGFSLNPNRIESEYRLLEYLAGLDVPVPSPVHLEASGNEPSHHWLAMTFVEGAPDFSPQDPLAFAQTVARLLLQVHAVPLSRAKLKALPDYPAIVSGFLSLSLDHLDDSLEAGRMLNAVRAAWPGEQRKCISPVLLHGDFWPGNILWQGGRVAALVDWESAATGPPYSDVAVMRLNLLWMLGAEAMHAFTETYFMGTRMKDPESLAVWDLIAALRPAGNIAAWAFGWAASGRADITEETMRRDHRLFRQAALVLLE